MYVVNYRPYQPGDFEQMYPIEEICFQPPLRFPRRYIHRLVESTHTVTWIAEEHGAIAGFLIADFGRIHTDGRGASGDARQRHWE
jgi:ribosomal-protein-alanine N-acetyltransferase